MQNFNLYNPVNVIFGAGESRNTGKYAAKLGKKALLVSYSDTTPFRALLEAVTASLNENGVSCIPFFRMQANPLLSHIKEGIALCRTEGIELCIAVGGGSVMDATKAIAAGTLYEGDPWKMFISRHDREVALPPEKTLPTIMIPTIPATSSEMNNIAVATNDETTEKAYIFTNTLYPKYAIMDPAVTCTLPPFQTAVGAVDAMSHVLEAYLNGDQFSPLQDRLHEGILVTIMDELRKVLRDPTNVEHRANLQWAATLSWNGYIQSGLNAPTPRHQLGHVRSALCYTTHGVTLAIGMDSYFRYTCTLNEERAARFALLGQKIFGIDRTGRDDRDAAIETADRIVSFMDEVGVPHRLSAAGIPTDEKTLEKIADEIVAHGCDAEGFLPSIPPIGKDGILKILNMAK